MLIGDFRTLYNHVILDHRQCTLFIFPNDGGPVICKYSKNNHLSTLGHCNFWIFRLYPLKTMWIPKAQKTPILTQDLRHPNLFISYWDIGRSELSTGLGIISLFAMIWCVRRMTVRLFGWCNTKWCLSYISLRKYYPLDNFGTVVGENPDCLLLSGTVVGENPDHVCWVGRPSPWACGPRAGSTWSSARGSGPTLPQTSGFNP